MAEPFLTPVEVENLRQPFRRVLQKYQLRPLEVDKNRALFHIHDRGSFWCSSESCGHQWQSNFSWLTFDLRELTVKKKWAMKCCHCLSLCYPDFEIDQMVEMFEIAVQLYKGCYRRTTFVQRHGPSRSPHNPPLCEKCEWGKSKCWEGRLR